MENGEAWTQDLSHNLSSGTMLNYQLSQMFMLLGNGPDNVYQANLRVWMFFDVEYYLLQVLFVVLGYAVRYEFVRECFNIDWSIWLIVTTNTKKFFVILSYKIFCLGKWVCEWYYFNFG